MEEEAREILRVAVASPEQGEQNLAELIRNRFAGLGGIELPDLRREFMREPPKFEE